MDSSLWNRCARALESELPESQFNTWVRPLQSLEGDGALKLLAPNRFVVDWVNANLLPRIGEWLRNEVQGDAPIVTVEVGSRPEPVSTASSATTVDVSSSGSRRSKGLVVGGRLNPDSTFENFVVGKSNQLAKAAAQQVGENPGKAYNPLFIYGGVGLGKTHLMHAVGHAIQARNPDARVAYVHSERFVSDMVKALQHNQMNEFKTAYRSLDALLIDDIQFFAGKERSQEEFFHTFNALHEAGRQIVIASDRPPSQIPRLQERLISRFSMGLIADIQAPDLETRFAILRAKAQQLNCTLPEPILGFIAQHITRNIRRLEGALLKVSSYSALTSKPIDLPTAERLLHDVLMEQAQNVLTIETIQKRVADHFQIRHSDMTSKRRPNNIAIPRQIAMYLARTLTRHSLQDIGDAFGGRDHGTVIHACKAVDNMMEQDAATRGSVEFLKSQLSR